MPNLTFHKSLPAHLSRVRLATFHQLVDYLLSARYTEEKCPGYAARDRRKLARSDVADAIDRGKRAGQVVEHEDVVARGDNPRATLLLESANEADTPTACFHHLLECWKRVGRNRITILYSPQNIRIFGASIAEFGPDAVTAELAASSIYFSLPAEKLESWSSNAETRGYYPRGNSVCRDGTPIVTYIAGAVYGGRSGPEILVPVIRTPVKASEGEHVEAVFGDYLRWVMGLHLEVTDAPLQIWRPDPETVLF